MSICIGNLKTEQFFFVCLVKRKYIVKEIRGGSTLIRIYKLLRYRSKCV